MKPHTSRAIQEEAMFFGVKSTPNSLKYPYKSTTNKRTSQWLMQHVHLKKYPSNGFTASRKALGLSKIFVWEIVMAILAQAIGMTINQNMKNKMMFSIRLK